MKKITEVSVIALLGLVLGGLTGCASSAVADSSGETQRTPSDTIDQSVTPSEAQTKLLAAGMDEASYRQGFTNYRECLAQEGYELLSFDDSGLVITYSIPDAAVQSGAHQLCYPREFRELDMNWQLANAKE